MENNNQNIKEDDDSKKPISCVLSKPCAFCYDRGKPRPDCPWFEIGECKQE
jgi:hypothetical protein